MEKDICEEKHRRIDECLENHKNRLNRHGEQIDEIQQDIIAMQKDTSHLQQAIKNLNESIKELIEEISKLKLKPLQRYEQVILIIISLVVGFLFSKITG